MTVTDSAGTQHVLNPIIGTGSEQAVRATIADLSVLADGAISVSAVQTDAAGNTQIIPSELTVVLDRSPNAKSDHPNNVSSPLTYGETTAPTVLSMSWARMVQRLQFVILWPKWWIYKEPHWHRFGDCLRCLRTAILGEGSVHSNSDRCCREHKHSRNVICCNRPDCTRSRALTLEHKLASMEKATRNTTFWNTF